MMMTIHKKGPFMFAAVREQVVVAVAAEWVSQRISRDTYWESC